MPLSFYGKNITFIAKSDKYHCFFPVRPILSNLERQDVAASQTLRAAFSKVLVVYLLLTAVLRISVVEPEPRAEIKLRPGPGDEITNYGSSSFLFTTEEIL
jgi:hypothetical protein